MSDSNITFVCCVESGYLEEQSIWMIESLRKFGGNLADYPVIAVKPRFGPSLSKKTMESFKSLNVLFVDERVPTNYDWFNFINKPKAMLLAEKYAKTESIGWLDSDIFIVDEPEEFVLKPGEDFAAFPVECKEMGTTGDGDAYEPLWQEFCKTLNIDIETLPWVDTAETKEKVRMYFNGGVFVYRLNTGFAKEWFDSCIKLLDSKVACKESSYNDGVKEMASIGFVAHKKNLNIRYLSYSHNYVMLSISHDDWYKEANLKSAKVVHYHDSMWPNFYETFMECLNVTHPAVEAWAVSKSPLKLSLPIHKRLLFLLLRTFRKKSADDYKASCKKV